MFYVSSDIILLRSDSFVNRVDVQLKKKTTIEYLETSLVGSSGITHVWNIRFSVFIELFLENREENLTHDQLRCLPINSVERAVIAPPSDTMDVYSLCSWMEIKSCEVEFE